MRILPRVADGGIYDPESDTWSPLPAECSEPRAGHTGVWIDSGAFFWGGTQKTGALLITPP
jgi:hypothetical protein